MSTLYAKLRQYLYVIHFETPYEHAQHYVGCTHNLKIRMLQHRNNTGANLLRHVNDAGIAWRLIAAWQTTNGFELEQHTKRQHNGPRYCPACSPSGIYIPNTLQLPQSTIEYINANTRIKP